MGKQLAYKVMPVIDGELTSGRNKNLGAFELRRGAVIRMPGNGIYMSPNRDYVLTHYAGLADEEVLLTLKYDTDEIITGNLEDREPEISVPKATIVKVEYLLEGELQRQTKPGHDVLFPGVG